MKKILLFLLITTTVFSQNGKVAEAITLIQKEGKSFVNYPLFTVQPAHSGEFSKGVANATITTLDLNGVNTIVAQKKDYIEVGIPYNGELISVLLYKVQIQAESYEVDSDKAKNINLEKGVHYRGIIKNDLNSLASFNFYKNQMSGIISNGKYKNLVIGKLGTLANITDYIIYSDTNLKLKNQFECATVDSGSQLRLNPGNREALLTDKCVTAYFEITHDIYEANGSSLEQTSIWMNSIFNNVQTIYSNDGISIALKSLFIWTTPDPYVGTVSSDYMYQFHNLRPVFNGDIGQLIGMGSNLGGVAAVVGGLCSDNNFSYSDVYFNFQTVPTYSWTVNVISHEIGHLMGSQHTHGCFWNGNDTAIDGCAPTANSAYIEGSCAIGPIPSTGTGGTIMSYCYLLPTVGVNFVNGFGEQPKARIIQTVQNAKCIGTDCIHTCISFINNLKAETTETTAVLSWDDANSEATDWEVAVVPYPFQVGATDWTLATNNPYSISELAPNTYYKFFVRPACGAAFEGTSRALSFGTNDNFCAGRSFVDTGGSANNYGDYENWTRTMIPINSNDKIKVNFNSINIENGYDFLYIYNGPDSNAPLLTPTGITGNTVVGPFESTDSSGALTFRFVSDTNTNGAGWDGNFSCTTLGTDENSFIDFSYYPNPVRNTLTITSKNEIQSIVVYSIDGRLLYSDVSHQLGTIVDMGKYAVGTYIFKVGFENKAVTFKIVRE